MTPTASFQQRVSSGRFELQVFRRACTHAADPELRPLVQNAQKAIARLTSEPREDAALGVKKG